MGQRAGHSLASLHSLRKGQAETPCLCPALLLPPQGAQQALPSSTRAWTPKLVSLRSLAAGSHGITVFQCHQLSAGVPVRLLYDLWDLLIGFLQSLVRMSLKWKATDHRPQNSRKSSHEHHRGPNQEGNSQSVLRNPHSQVGKWGQVLCRNTYFSGSFRRSTPFISREQEPESLPCRGPVQMKSLLPSLCAVESMALPLVERLSVYPHCGALSLGVCAELREALEQKSPGVAVKAPGMLGEGTVCSGPWEL